MALARKVALNGDLRLRIEWDRDLRVPVEVTVSAEQSQTLRLEPLGQAAGNPEPHVQEFPLWAEEDDKGKPATAKITYKTDNGAEPQGLSVDVVS